MTSSCTEPSGFRVERDGGEGPKSPSETRCGLQLDPAGLTEATTRAVSGDNCEQRISWNKPPKSAVPPFVQRTVAVLCAPLQSSVRSSSQKSHRMQTKTWLPIDLVAWGLSKVHGPQKGIGACSLGVGNLGLERGSAILDRPLSEHCRTALVLSSRMR